jgi:hypothetical protein
VNRDAETACAGKLRHASKRAARKALSAVSLKTGGRHKGGTVYRCDYCSFWHVGHHRPRPRNRKLREQERRRWNR